MLPSCPRLYVLLRPEDMIFSLRATCLLPLPPPTFLMPMDGLDTRLSQEMVDRLGSESNFSPETRWSRAPLPLSGKANKHKQTNQTNNSAVNATSVQLLSRDTCTTIFIRQGKDKREERRRKEKNHYLSHNLQPHISSLT